MEGKEGDNLFLEFIFDGMTFDNIKWEKLIEKWKMNVTTDKSTKRCSVYNDNSICITGESEEILLDKLREDEPGIEELRYDKPTNNVSLIISDKIETKKMFNFLNDLMCAIFEADDIDITIYKNEIKDTIHPEFVIKRMTM